MKHNCSQVKLRSNLAANNKKLRHQVRKKPVQTKKVVLLRKVMKSLHQNMTSLFTNTQLVKIT